MNQNLPLCLPKIIKKYIEQGVNGYGIEFTFNGSDYVIDPLGDEFDVMRITNTRTRQMINITEHDHIGIIRPMTEWLHVIQYIEANVTFSVVDWIKHYTAKFPFYSGSSISTYRQTDGDTNDMFVVIHSTSNVFFYVSSDGIPRLIDNLEFVYTDDSEVRTVGIAMVDSTSSIDHIEYINMLAEDMLIRAFNNEYIISYVEQHNVKDIPIGNIEDKVWSYPSIVKTADMTIVINVVRKIITFINGDYEYQINMDGSWSKNKTYEKPTNDNLNHMYHTSFIHYSIKEVDERAFIKAVIKMLNSRHNPLLMKSKIVILNNPSIKGI